MKSHCPNCKVAFKIDELKIPVGGVRVRCPKCETRFHVQKPVASPDGGKNAVKKECPKCGHIQEMGDSCIKCGVIFEKFTQRRKEEPQEDSQRSGISEPGPDKDAVKEFRQSGFKTIAKKTGFMICVVCVLGLIFMRFVLPRIEAGNFTDLLPKYGAREFNLPRSEQAVEAGEIPYRIGKMLIVEPKHSHERNTFPPRIHPCWYKLGFFDRASKPEEIDTLIRLKKIIGGSQYYQGNLRGRLLTAYKLVFDVYDWREQKYIGQWVIDPRTQFPDKIMEEEIDAMIEMTSDKSALKFIKNMPER